MISCLSVRLFVCFVVMETYLFLYLHDVERANISAAFTFSYSIIRSIFSDIMELGLKMNMWSKNKADSGKMWLKRLNLTPNMIVKNKTGHL